MESVYGQQWFETISVKWTLGAKFWTISSGAIVRMQKNTEWFFAIGWSNPAQKYIVKNIITFRILWVNGSNSSQQIEGYCFFLLIMQPLKQNNE